MNERQLSLFELPIQNIKHNFTVTEVDKDLEPLIHNIVNKLGERLEGVIKNDFHINLDQNELIDILDKSFDVEQLNYGWKLYYKSNGKTHEVYARFVNQTTSKNADARKHIIDGFKYLER
ncbi:MAG TPA: hypothetical protein VJY12_06370 [Dysgonamonadaceae bacterium]|nr:hypothetical protein [Dysgonamonadaceae bacterium]